MLRKGKDHLTGFISRLIVPENATQLFLIRFAIFGGCLALILHYLEFISLPVAPFTTQGAIYVESPEVYTRERLVNDRYDQDFWLHEQLRKLDVSQAMLTAKREERIVGGNANPSEAIAVKPTATVDSRQEGITGLSFDQDFRIRVAVRDTIRQLLLENMLDDRHDLTGNSVYGLKFDTAVIPGSNTRKHAFVRVLLEVDDLLKIKLEQDEYNMSRSTAGRQVDHVIAFYKDPKQDLSSTTNPLSSPYRLYKDWLASLEERFNTAVSDKFKSDDFQDVCKNSLPGEKKHRLIDETIREMVELVLGGDGRLVGIEPLVLAMGIIYLPDPWSKFMALTYTEVQQGGACDIRPLFRVGRKMGFYLREQRGQRRRHDAGASRRGQPRRHDAGASRGKMHHGQLPEVHYHSRQMGAVHI